MNYNNHKAIRYISNNIIEYLIENNEVIWKLLKYSTPDALMMDDLTKDEKRELIYNGWVYNGDQYVMDKYENKAIFRQPWIDDAEEKASTMLRIYLSSLIPTTNIITTALYTIEVVCHNKNVSIISNLGDNDSEVPVNSENRIELIVQQILETLNGQNVGSIGKIFFDMNGSYMTKGNIGVYNNRNYYGFKLIMGAHINETKTNY